MSSWPGKYVIGLTGNIATGKSVVRKMLEHLGAYGIDADTLAHRVLAKGAPAYQPVVDTFGKWILSADGQIDRAKLGKLVFADPEALARLEFLTHPYVAQAVDILVRRAPQSVIVIEAIKLIESGLRARCDSLWVTYTPRNIQIARLVQKRQMHEAAAIQRTDAQRPQEEKLAVANFVIRNEGSFESTWRQVQSAWQQTFPSTGAEPEEKPVAQTQTLTGKLEIMRASPRQSEEIAVLITRLSQGKRTMNSEQVMEAFGEKAYLIIKLNGVPAGVVGWKVENLVACTDDVFIEAHIPLQDAMGMMMHEVERASSELQSEASLLFLPNNTPNQDALSKSIGYQIRTPESLGVRAWEEAARETMQPNSVLLFKQLRQDRVLKPV